MAKRNRQHAEEVNPQADHHPTPEGPVTTAAVADRPQSMGDAVDEAFNPLPPVDQNANGEKKTFQRARDPFAIETINTPDNQIHLGKSSQMRAFVIRFNENPNEGRDKDDPHPVLKVLKDAGYRFQPINDGGMAWKKPWSGDQFSMRDEMDARNVSRDAAEAMGATNLDRGPAR